MKNKLEQTISEMKSSSVRERNDLISQISQLEAKRTELEMRETTIKENLLELKNEKINLEKILRIEIQKEKYENKAVVDNLNQKLNNTEESLKELHNKFFLTKSEFDKEKALLVQKIQFLEKSAEDANIKEQNYVSQIATSKTSLTTQFRDTSTKYEINIKNLQSKIDSLNEKLSEQEDIIKQKEVQIDSLFKKGMEDTENKDELIFDYGIKIKMLEKTLQETKYQQDNEMRTFKTGHGKKLQELSDKLDEAAIIIKTKDETVIQN